MANQSTGLVVANPPSDRFLPALELALSHRPFAERMRLMHSLLEMAEVAGEAPDLPGLFEAHDGKAAVGAALVLLMPGKTALVYQPRLRAGATSSATTALWASIDRFLHEQQIVLAQEVLPADAQTDAENARLAGFSIETELIYLSCGRDAFPVEIAVRNLVFEPYQKTEESRLAEILPQTYEQTLDCQELNGVRSSHDVIEGYAATGNGRTDLWRLLVVENRTVGCLLLARHGGAIVELVYVGLTPAARGNGYGYEATRYAQWLTREAGGEELTLAVDARNSPARRIDERAGFREFDRRRVLIKVIRP